MKAILVSIAILLFSDNLQAQGRVGINTTTPAAMLHVKDSAVVFTGQTVVPSEPGNVPVSGAGIRMMWYPDKAAFRAGIVTSDNWDTDSLGVSSFAAGADPKATGVGSVALGTNTTAAGNNSTAMGVGTTAENSAATSFGSNTTASGVSSTAWGNGSIASGNYSTAGGYFNRAHGISSTAMGAATIANGSASATFGESTMTIGDASAAFGYNTVVSGALATSFGNATSSRAFACFTIGQFNDSIASSNVTNWIATDPVLIIGNGSNYNSRSNALTVFKNGNISATGNFALTTGEVNRATTGAANLIPICYGSVAATAVINSGTTNFTVTNPATGEYDITIAAESYSNSGYVTNVTVVNSSSPRIATTNVSSGVLIVKIWDITGNPVNGGFHFTVYKQ